MMKRLGIVIALLTWTIPVVSHGADEVADVIYVRGQAEILRGEQRISCELKTPLLQNDAITTAAKGTVKVLFKDNSILTIAPDSSMSISKYLYDSTQQQSQSLFKLLYGKLRAVVGRSSLKIETSTAVAGTRGTVFDIWVDVATNTTYVSVIEGAVELKNILAEIEGAQIVTAGNTSSVTSGQPPLPPTTTPPQPGGDQGGASGQGDGNLPVPEPPQGPGTLSGPQTGGQIITNNPPIHQTPKSSTKVGINVVFP